MKIASLLCLIALLSLIAPLRVDAATPQLVTATTFGSAGDDLIEGLAIAADGSILIAGTLGQPLTALPGHPRLRTLGEVRADSQYGVGFIAILSPDGREVRHFVQFAKGICQPTSIVIRETPEDESKAAVIYVASYATAGLEGLIADHEPLIGRAETSQKKLTRWAPFVHRHDPQIDAQRHDERGMPFVIQLDATLSRVTAGTFLEGWQSVWHVPRPLREDQWQPIDIGLLPSGDLLIAHDGGIISDHGERKPDYRDFYHLPDHVSRLSPDLKTRRWKLDIFTPPNDPAKVKQHLGWDWPHPTLGNTRIHRLRVSPDGQRFAIVGWSPSETAKEPWWSPFCFIHDTDGKRLQTLYTPSPMAGDDDRMNTLVSDSAVASVHFDQKDNLLMAVKGDGGNSILLRDPRDFSKLVSKEQWNPNLWGFGGRTLFWGGLVRVDGQTGELIRGHTIHGRTNNRVTAAWPIDMAPLPEGRVAVANRHSTGFSFSKNAWSTAEFTTNRHRPGGSLLILNDQLNPIFTTSLGDLRPTRIETHHTRLVMIGEARSDALVLKNPLLPHAGQHDGYLIIVELDPK